MSGYTVKISLEHTHPPVWRRVILPEHISFYHLHQVIQILFGWEDAHLHDFTCSNSNTIISLPEAMFYGKPLPEKSTLIDEFLQANKWIRYTYDFGDEWKHKIVLESVVEDYDKRYATILKVKGDNFEEDSGGLRYDDDEYPGRIPFSLEQVANQLEKLSFPYQKRTLKSKTTELTEYEKVQIKSLFKKLLNTSLKKASTPSAAKPKKPSAMANSIDMLKNFATQVTDIPVSQNVSTSVIYEQLTLFPMENNLSASSIKSGYYKTISQKSMAEMLTKLSMQEAKDYNKYLQISYTGNPSKKTLINNILTALSEQPQFYLYVLQKEELQELEQLIKKPDGVLKTLPDVNSLIKGMTLGLLECECIDNAHIQSVTISFASDADAILTSFKSNWKRKQYNKLLKTAEQISLLLLPYGIMDMDTLYAKYCYYWGKNITREELLRAAYWHCRFCNRVQTADCFIDSKSYIALYDIDMNKTLTDIISYASDIQYKALDPEELFVWTQGFCNVYESWAAYENYLLHTASIDENMLANTIHTAYTNVVTGVSASEFITYNLSLYKPQSIRESIDFWFLMLDMIMTTGLVGLKGFSRTEYIEQKGVLPQRFAPIDINRTVSDISQHTHIYEMPADIQERIYAIYFLEPEESSAKLKKLIHEIHTENEELLMLLAEMCTYSQEYDYAKKILTKLKKLNKEDDGIEMIEHSIECLEESISDFAFDYENIPEADTSAPWDYWDTPEPYRRTSEKIGRNDPCPCGSGKKYKKCCGKN